MKQLFLLALLLQIDAVFGTSSAEPNAIYNCDVDYQKWGCDPKKLVQGDDWHCSMNATEMQGRLMPWATWPLDSDCYEVTAGDESSPITSYIPSDPQLSQYLYINIRTVCYDMAFRGILMYAVNSAGKKVGGWNIPADTTVRWRQPWENIPGHYCENSLMHASGVIKPYFNQYRFEAPLVGEGEITFKILIKKGDANEGHFYRPLNVVRLTEAAASLPSPIFVQTAAGQTCSQFCQSKSESLACDREAIALLNSSAALNEKLIQTVPCNLPFVASSIAESSYADPVSGLCYFTSAASCEVASGNQFCACTEREMSGASGLTSKLSTVLAASVLLSLLDKRFAVAALFLVYLIGASEAHNYLGTVSRSFGASTINPCKQSRTGNPHVQIGPNQDFSITFFNNHEGYTYFTLVALEDVPKLGKLKNADREIYINGALPQHHTNITTGKYQKFMLNIMGNTTTQWALGNILRSINSTTDPLYYPEGSLGPKANANFNKRKGVQTLYAPHMQAEDRWVSYNNPAYPFIKAMWKFKITVAVPKDMALFKLPEGTPQGRYVIQYAWSGYYDCVDIDYVNHPVDLIYGTAPAQSSWVRVDHCTVKNPRGSFPTYGPELVISNIEACRTKVERRQISLGSGVIEKVSIIVASNLTAYDAYNFQRYSTNNGTIKNFAYPSFPGFEAVFPWATGVGGINASAAGNFLKPNNKDKVFCWGAVPPEFTTTTDIYFTTDDPLDPVFYSTCWVENSENIFADVAPLTKMDTNWKYNDKCVSCADRELLTNPKTIPVWRTTEDCTNCDLEPEEPSRNYTNLAPTPPGFAMVQKFSTCSGFWSNATQVGTIPGFYNCTTEAQSYGCWRTLGANIRMFPDQIRHASFSAEECAILVAADAACSNIFMWMDLDMKIGQNASSCVCMTTRACCGNCVVRRGVTNPAPVGTVNMNIYETRSIPDPGCTNGVKSADGTFCCTSTCGDCRIAGSAPSPSPTPTPTQSPRPAVNSDAYALGYRSVHMCRDRATPVDRTCDKYAPPCYL